jgi:hypothetical protein
VLREQEVNSIIPRLQITGKAFGRVNTAIERKKAIIAGRFVKGLDEIKDRPPCLVKAQLLYLLGIDGDKAVEDLKTKK